MLSWLMNMDFAGGGAAGPAGDVGNLFTGRFQDAAGGGPPIRAPQHNRFTLPLLLIGVIKWLTH